MRLRWCDTQRHGIHLALDNARNDAHIAKGRLTLDTCLALDSCDTLQLAYPGLGDEERLSDARSW
jgi:hypothetical protein